MYLGITTRDVEKYKGSGKLWLRHIKKYGKDNIDTVWYMLFLDQNSLSEFALMQSTIMNVVESTEFANLKHELGTDGGTTSHSIETRARMSKTRKGVKHSAEHTAAISDTKKKYKYTASNQFKKARLLGLPDPVVSDDIKHKISSSLLGRIHTDATKDKIALKTTEMWQTIENITCPHCSKTGRGPNMKRYHFDKCKKNQS